MKVYKATDFMMNLCDNCLLDIAECLPGKIEFGNNIGNDNVIECSEFIPFIESEFIQIVE